MHIKGIAISILGRTRRFDKYIAVKRQLNDIHSLNSPTKGHHFWSNMVVKKI